MAFENLSEENFILYAVKAYDKPNCVKSEFQEDLKRFNYIKRLFHRYNRHGELKERLILNHLIVLYNVFGVEPTTRMLFYHVHETSYPALKTFLLFLSYMPERVRGIRGKTIFSSSINVDMKVAEILRNIK